jgi:hypothetical protein
MERLCSPSRAEPRDRKLLGKFNGKIITFDPLVYDKKRLLRPLIKAKHQILNFNTLKRVHYERTNEFYATQRNGRNP